MAFAPCPRNFAQSLSDAKTGAANRNAIMPFGLAFSAHPAAHTGRTQPPMVILGARVAGPRCPQPHSKMGGFMSKALFAALLAAGLIGGAAAGAHADRARRRAAPESQSQDQEAADRGSARRARAHQEMRRRMERSQGRRQNREGNEVAEILERLQQAPQRRPAELARDLRANSFRDRQTYRGRRRNSKSRRRPLLSSEPGRRGATALRSSPHDAHRPV